MTMKTFSLAAAVLKVAEQDHIDAAGSDPTQEYDERCPDFE